MFLAKNRVGVEVTKVGLFRHKKEGFIWFCMIYGRNKRVTDYSGSDYSIMTVFERRIRLKRFFYDQQEEETDTEDYRSNILNPSRCWTPWHTNDHKVESY